jgi:hypothetical protein
MHNLNNGGNVWTKSAITATHGINKPLRKRRNNLDGQFKNTAQL